LVKVSQNKKVVQHLEGGIVDKILVREGDEVKAGQILMQLRDERVDASVSLAQGHLWAKIALAARLKAESQIQPKIEWPQEMLDAKAEPEVVDAMKKEGDVFVSRLRDMEAKFRSTTPKFSSCTNSRRRPGRTGRPAEHHFQSEVEIVAKNALLEEKYIDKGPNPRIEPRLSTAKRAGACAKASPRANSASRTETAHCRPAQHQPGKLHFELSKVADRHFPAREQLRPCGFQKTPGHPVSGRRYVLNMHVHPKFGGHPAGEPSWTTCPRTPN
jgi:pyruvate/2-oxoglutarate dehydrogenase complex dihydrolipoamide acyltransferase (E2) component